MDALPEFLACPLCRGPLSEGDGAVSCGSCGERFPRGEHGFLEFEESGGGARETGPRLEAYACHQESAGGRRFRDYLFPFATVEPALRVLDVGCGVGLTPALFAEQRFDAYGVDLPKAARFWAEAGRDPRRLFCADAAALPFADRSFDLVLSLGVVEHIGTVTGHCTLASDYRARRRAYARELVRVARSGGRVLLSCPNKSFPVDVHHGPGDAASSPGCARALLSGRLGLNVHRTWGKYHLLSYPEVERLFLGAGATSVTALPLAGFFSFQGLRSGQLRSLVGVASWYLEHLPAALRATPLNPFVLVQVRV